MNKEKGSSNTLSTSVYSTVIVSDNSNTISVASGVTRDKSNSFFPPSQQN